MPSTRPAPTVASVAKAADVLMAFTSTVPTQSVREIAARTGIPRSTVHALCTTLTEAGLLEPTADGYQLGPTVLELGGQVIERTGLVRAAEGVIDTMVRIPEAEAHLGQLTQGWVVYLDRQAGARHIPMRNRVGQRAPAYLTGCGKAALSVLPAAEAEEMIRRQCAAEQQPLPDLAAIRAELVGIRRRGYAVSRTFQHDRTSIAAPIVDLTGRPLGGVSLAVPSAMLSAQVLARARTAVTDGAQRITTRLGRGR